MSRLPDPVAEGLTRGWRVLDASRDPLPATLRADVAIIGTGAGGGITAEVLARAGLKVVMIEEGPLKTSRDFSMRENEAYPQLYQESAARKTRDQAITILQGRCAGGSTTVNWTSSFRTPDETLNWWGERWALPGYEPETLSPWFAQAERRLGIGPWLVPPNENNDLLRRGGMKLGIPVPAIQRNVRGCLNLGYCGMGCPANAKQSMLVTTIPAALELGATLLTRARANRLRIVGRRVEAIEVQALDADGLRPSGRSLEIRAEHVVLAGGAINSPAVLLRSRAPDPRGIAGTRTFLHPVVLSVADHEQEVRGFEGAPQTRYTDHFLGIDPIDGPIGFKLEAPPIHPVLFAVNLAGFGPEHAAAMRRFAHAHALLALMRDGFHERSPGGRVSLRDDGSPVLDYPLDDFVFDGARRAFRAMAEIQFAAGARSVRIGHERATPQATLAGLLAELDRLVLAPFDTKVVSAHVMGGCAMSADDARGLVRPDGRHHHVDNLSVHDGSVFPTSIGANPQLSIYGIVTRMSAGLARSMTGREPEPLA
ncbi:MAG: GMC family oxidoreductase [Burkholderiales bacterium]|nr:GMC family oxidoreductase [Burkholderiales bacterium]